MTDITTMEQAPTERPRGRPQIFTEEKEKETMKIHLQQNDQNTCETRTEDVRLDYIENRDTIRERKR